MPLDPVPAPLGGWPTAGPVAGADPDGALPELGGGVLFEPDGACGPAGALGSRGTLTWGGSLSGAGWAGAAGACPVGPPGTGPGAGP